jgi:hypothetical protein
MTSSEIIEIIKVCSEYKVASIQIGDFIADFFTVVNPIATPQNMVENSPITVHEADASVNRDYEELILTDPMAYEKLINTGGEDA